MEQKIIYSTCGQMANLTFECSTLHRTRALRQMPKILAHFPHYCYVYSALEISHSALFLQIQAQSEEEEQDELLIASEQLSEQAQASQELRYAHLAHSLPSSNIFEHHGCCGTTISILALPWHVLQFSSKKIK